MKENKCPNCPRWRPFDAVLPQRSSERGSFGSNCAALICGFPSRAISPNACEDRRILGLNRRAKYLVASLDDGTALIAHLGMSGSFRIENQERRRAASPFRARKTPSTTTSSSISTALASIYNDPRRFGFMTLAVEAELASHPFFAGLGVEPLSNAFNAETLARLFADRKTSLKAALLDQRLIAGLGNIYVCEALHRAGLAPDRPAGDLARRDGAPTKSAEKLARLIREVLEEAVLAGGSSLRDHRQADGTLGYFQHNFRVYNRVGEACPGSGCGGIIQRRTQNGRSTFYCPKCQK